MAKEKIIVDTDIGQDMDDACAIAYLCAHPDAEIVGITTVTGDAVPRARLVSSVCNAMGKPDIPIYPGLETCILKEQHQAFCPQNHLLESWPHKTEFPEREALYFMQQTIRENPGEIILAGIGPLSNIGVLFQMDPELPSLLKGIYLMNGIFQKYDLQTWTKKHNDNSFSIATNGRNLEWNTCIDPYASAIVFEHTAKTFRVIGEDMTHQVVLSPEEFRDTLARKLPKILVEMSDAWIDYDPLAARKLTYHDPVAVTTIFNDKVCKFIRGNVGIETISPSLRGFSTFEEDPDGKHEIAYEVDPQEFFDEFSKVF
ncbi:nucleoside hydrolase [Clostridium sp. AF19-22AC]|jgi:purine nucleosidase|uniref:nucleoside hydrolase n=1 Tax=Clostridia TaxID=186801 RepID=UPI000E50FD1A|nr:MULTISPECIES: nucleoside hydrolase [Clostridia]RHR20466.1 nucleoside hydrolase [Clostridium sp. AF19-22AC]